MYTQHSDIRNGAVIKRPDDARPIVNRLLAQTQDSMAIYENADGQGVMPASLFFQTHREALPGEIEDAAPRSLAFGGRREELAAESETSAPARTRRATADDKE